MITMNLFKTIKNYKKQGRGIREISRITGISRKTVSKYYTMPSEKYAEYQQNAYKKVPAFEPFKQEIIEIYQQNENKVYASSVYDLLEEKHGSEMLPGKARTLRNYISHLIQTGEIMKKPQHRVYMPVDELPYGKQLQVDFGQVTIKSGETVYIFASVLSASRYRYISIQKRPFTALDVVLHLIDCFEYIGGMPLQIVIDQDRALVVDENDGDILLTKTFKQFKEEMGFDLYVCRKADPESKGKVENLVKFVKTSFFSARVFTAFEDIQSALSSWLVRTANGKISQATGAVPANLLSREQEKLKPLRASMFRRDSILDREERKVDSKSFISVEASKYSVPIDYRQKKVWIYKTENRIFIYDSLNGKEIAQHNRCMIPGEKVSKKNHFKDFSMNQNQLREELIKELNSPAWEEYINKNYRLYKRYFREQYSGIKKFLTGEYDEILLQRALELCGETDGYSANNLIEAYSYVKGVWEESHEDILPKLLTGIQAVKADARNPKVSKRKLSYYKSLVSIIGGVL